MSFPRSPMNRKSWPHPSFVGAENDMQQKAEVVGNILTTFLLPAKLSLHARGRYWGRNVPPESRATSGTCRRAEIGSRRWLWRFSASHFVFLFIAGGCLIFASLPFSLLPSCLHFSAWRHVLRRETCLIPLLCLHLSLSLQGGQGHWVWVSTVAWEAC